MYFRCNCGILYLTTVHTQSRLAYLPSRGRAAEGRR